MVKFIFNDCLPDACSADEYSAALHRTLMAFKTLSTRHDICVLTAAHQDTLAISQSISLKQCILGIKDRTERTYAFRLFTRYPLCRYLDEDDAGQWLLENDFHIIIDNKREDAFNLALAAYYGNMSFSLGLCADLRKNSLELIGSRAVCNIDNLYGEDSNTAYISGRLDEVRDAAKGLMEKISDVVGAPVEIRDTFVSDFEEIGYASRQAILKKFSVAAGYGQLRPVRPDEKTIKDVTPANGRKGHLYELRIFSPEVLRVYFSQVGNIIILIDIGGKNNQDLDIARAYSRL